MQSARSPRRILLLFAVPDGAGAMRMMFHFALAFRQSGCDVCVAHGDSTAQSETIPGSARNLLNQLIEAGVKCVPCADFRKRTSRTLTSRLSGIVKEQDSQVLIGFHPLDFKYALSVAGQMNRACVLSLQNKQVFWGSGPARWVKSLVFRHWLRRYATCVVCTSQVVRDHLISEFGARPELCSVIPNGIPVSDELPDRVEVSKFRQSLGLSDDDVLLVNTGRIDIQKGQDLLLEALQGISSKNWMLVLVGDVSGGRSTSEQQGYLTKLKSLISRHQWASRVHFLGWRDDVEVILTAADIYVHTSRWEGPAAPLAVMEAMAARLPVVMTDCCGRPEGFIDGTHGYVAQSENLSSISDAISNMMSCDVRQRRAMGLRCRELVEMHYEINQISGKFVDVVDALLPAPG